jgi:hypothetical protein
MDLLHVAGTKIYEHRKYSQIPAKKLSRHGQSLSPKQLFPSNKRMALAQCKQFIS